MIKNDTIKDYLIYARKSSESEDRQVLSIDSQKQELLDIAKRDGLNIVDIREEAHSAKAPGRPVFNQLLDEVEQGKAQGIIVWNPDRMSRNSVDTGRIIYLFDLGKLQELVTPSQVFRNTPNDKFLLSLLCSQAKLDNDNKGINVKRGLKAKAERGIYPCPAPTGYVNNKYADRGNKTVEIDPDRFGLIQKMFEMVLSQKYTPMQTLKIATKDWKLTQKNGEKIARSTWYRMLTNPIYAESFEYPINSGKWYKAIHKAMITDEQFDLIQAILGKKGKQRPKTHIFAFTGLMRCGECGARITCEKKTKRQKNGNVHQYTYYHCTKRVNPDCKQRSIEEEDLENQIKQTLATIKIPPGFHDWALDWLRKTNHLVMQTTSMIVASQQKAYRQCLAEIDELIDMRSAKEITREEFAKKKRKLEEEKKRLNGLLNDTDASVDRWMQKAEEEFDFARDASQEFNDGGIEKKRHILSRLGSNLILEKQTLRVDLDEVLKTIQQASKEVTAINERLEPAENVDNKAQLEQSYQESPVLLSSLDSNQNKQLQRLLSYR